MPIPIYYSWRNLATRRLTTALTSGGMALVVFVFAAALMLAAGLEKTLVDTGSEDNVICIRKGAATEVQSGVERDQAAAIETAPEVALDGSGTPLAAKELMVLINLRKRGSGKPANVIIRGVGPRSLALRPQVKLAAGRMARPGASEVVAGKSVAERFEGARLGESLRFGQREWRIVGIIDAAKTGFDSEIWGDAEQLMQAFRRQAYSSMLFRLAPGADFAALKARIETDPRLTCEIKREADYYREQSETLAKFLRVLGVSLTAVFSLGAIIGAMITMHSAVANRIPEIGALRALGFQRSDILTAFLAEALLLGLLGAVLGLGLACFLQLLTISTMNFQTFSELAFGFSLSPAIALESLAFGLFMGLAGGLAPSVRACRISVVEALRAS
ncbi:MAG: ABC transporter permease [Desulfovibrionaceae bacterium]|nr:ABC transporter permease [Desulfovibrionaceae bacterium]